MLNGTNGRPSLQCCHRHHLLAVSSHLFFPLSRKEYISKYRSIEKFMKLPFQRVIIQVKRSSNKGVMSVLL
jgi:hypothetical protein